jgi:general secretion pathway protein G
VPAPATRNRTARRGFTLIELLVVLVILGLLATIAAPQVIRFIGGAKSDTAKVQVERLATTLDLFRLGVGRYPTEQESLRALVERPSGAAAWNGPYLTKDDALTDPWGRPYVYVFPGKHGAFDLYTLGADGREGGEGEDRDITNW